MAPRRERKLRFCPNSNDLLYPKENLEERILVYFCKNCGYELRVPSAEYCVYVNEVRHSVKERTIILQVTKITIFIY